MKQLSGLDASFLSMETPTTFGHVNGLGIYERPSPDFEPYPLVRERMAAIIGRLEPMRRRLVEVPFGLDHPYWIDDPHFDLDFHVRHLGLAPPGTMDQLGEQVARIIGRPMDRTHPLWEMYVIEGLADGRWAVLTKTHHATVDGAAGVLLLTMLTDDCADAPTPEPVAWDPEPVPSDMELLKRTALHLAANPVKATRLQLRLVRDIARSAGIDSVAGLAGRTRDAITAVARAAQNPDGDEEHHLLPAAVTPAPPTPWNHTITAHRKFALRSVPMADIKALKNAAGCTVNDVVMAICAGALRAYLIDHDALPDEPLRAMVPVSIRTGAEADPWTNRVSAILAEVPTHLVDPLERLRRCHDAMVDAKHQLDVIPEDAIGELTETLTPLVTSSAMRLVSRLKLADRIHLPANLTISNVPGPRSPLYLAGARLENYIPVSIVVDGLGLNITVHSYVDSLDIGIVVARWCSDVEHMADLHLAEIDALFEATGATRNRPSTTGVTSRTFRTCGGVAGPTTLARMTDADDHAHAPTRAADSTVPRTVATMLVGTDGSPSAERGVRYAAGLASQLGARVLLVHAVGLLERLPGHEAEPASAVRTEVERLLRNEWCAPLVDAGIEHVCLLEAGPPVLAVPRVAEREGVDLIVVASHGRGNAAALPLGSTSHALVQVSTVPVLVVPAAAGES